MVRENGPSGKPKIQQGTKINVKLGEKAVGNKTVIAQK